MKAVKKTKRGDIRFNIIMKIALKSKVSSIDLKGKCEI